ncbi:MAG: hypothetical protein KAR51_01215 [Candidatus Aenigmarchaeota archaeon]|nr:hypothetical protein [Candidatus Aenigmarchaeota archaeon]
MLIVMVFCGYGKAMRLNAVSSRRRRDGFIHSLEAVIAIMILLSYSARVIDVVPDGNDWRISRLSQESREIAEVMSRLGYTDMLVADSQDSFLALVSYISYLQNMGVAISTHNLINPILRVGILTDDNDVYLCYSSNISQNLFGLDESIIINGRETRFEVHNTTWVGDWRYFDVLLIPFEGSYVDMLGNITLMNSSYHQKLSTFLQSGKGIIQVSNLSNESLVNLDVQKDIFGLKWNSTTVLPSGSEETYMSYARPSEDIYSLHKYFHVFPSYLSTESSVTLNVSDADWWNMTIGTVDVYLGETNYTIGMAKCTQNIPTPCSGDNSGTLNYSEVINSTNGIYGFNIVSLKHKDYGVIVINSSGIDYDLVYIDENQDRNFTNDGNFSGLSAGDILSLDGNNYTIVEIDSRGNYIMFNIEMPHNFSVLNMDNEVYHVDGFDNNLENRSRFVAMESELVTSYGGNLPVSIVNYGKFTGRTAWFTDNIVSRDDWHFLRSLVLWVSPKTYIVSEVSDSAMNVMSEEFVLLANKDVSQPYIMKLKVWYYD